VVGAVVLTGPGETIKWWYGSQPPAVGASRSMNVRATVRSNEKQHWLYDPRRVGKREEQISMVEVPDGADPSCNPGVPLKPKLLLLLGIALAFATAVELSRKRKAA
jgi:hypothetical protein